MAAADAPLQMLPNSDDLQSDLIDIQHRRRPHQNFLWVSVSAAGNRKLGLEVISRVC